MHDITDKPMRPVASVNGVALHEVDELVLADALRQRACIELLRQAAQNIGLLDSDDVSSSPGRASEAANAAIEILLEETIRSADPSMTDCQRYYEAHLANYRTGERVHVRHILFAVTPGMEVAKMRSRAETCLLDLRCHDGSGGDTFAPSARDLSNCPSAIDGGDLGWLLRTDCVPELSRELFGRTHIGVLPELVHSRFGFHVVEVLARDLGVEQPFESVRASVESTLRQHSYVTALRQYLSVLAGQAVLIGVELDATTSPRVP